MQPQSSKAGFTQLIPFIIFILIFLSSALFFQMQISAIFACLIATICAFFTFLTPTSINKKIEIFVSGAAQPTIIAMLYIFIFSSAFTYILKIIGGTDAAINVGLHIIPTAYLLPGLFIIVSIFATAIGTSMGTIAAFLPIAVGFSKELHIDPALIAAIVVSGAMLGDNLSIISDTTIAATQTTRCSAKDKFRTNFLLVLPAFILTALVLLYTNLNLPALQLAHYTISSLDLLKTSPYAIVLVLASLGLDVIAVLILGIICAASIGIYLEKFNYLQATGLIAEGFSHNAGGVQEVIILSLFVSGLAAVVDYNGGIAYLLEKFSKRIENKGSAELHIVLLTFLVNAAIAINTIAILVTGPVAKKIGDKFSIPNYRIASIVDITACICQGILPYAPQLLLASTLAGVSSLSIIPYLYYQGFMALVLVASIGKTYLKHQS